MGDVGYKFVCEFRIVLFIGEVIEILDNQRQKLKFVTGRIKHNTLTSFSLTQNIEAFQMNMTMTTMTEVEAGENDSIRLRFR